MKVRTKRKSGKQFVSHLEVGDRGGTAQSKNFVCLLDVIGGGGAGGSAMNAIRG